MTKIVLKGYKPEWGGITLEALLEHNPDLMTRPLEYNRSGEYFGQPFVKSWGIYRGSEMVGKWYPADGDNPRGRWYAVNGS